MGFPEFEAFVNHMGDLYENGQKYMVEMTTNSGVRQADLVVEGWVSLAKSQNSSAKFAKMFQGLTNEGDSEQIAKLVEIGDLKDLDMTEIWDGKNLEQFISFVGSNGKNFDSLIELASLSEEVDHELAQETQDQAVELVSKLLELNEIKAELKSGLVGNDGLMRRLTQRKRMRLIS